MRPEDLPVNRPIWNEEIDIKTFSFFYQNRIYKVQYYEKVISYGYDHKLHLKFFGEGRCNFNAHQKSMLDIEEKKYNLIFRYYTLDPDRGSMFRKTDRGERAAETLNLIAVWDEHHAQEIIEYNRLKEKLGH